MTFDNVYEDDQRARSYARLEFPGTYYLAYRDLPQIIAEHVRGRNALDFGCGTGRSARFLVKLGFNVVGVDISQSMIKQAREIDPTGDYRLVEDGDLSQLKEERHDLVLSAFTFDNIPTAEKKVTVLSGIRDILKPGGILVNLVSSPEIYLHEWASFTTKDFPENRKARSGDRGSDEAYQEVYRKARLHVAKSYRPLAHEDEPYDWVSETTVAP
jgi:ubiquinone/menaquinone biosynthesis C-methylase UbiE